MSAHATAGPRVADNRTIAERLEQVAALLEAQGANQYRVQAWRTGAATIRGLSSSAAALFEREGIEGLDRLPGIGPSLARAVAEIVERGTLATLERMRGEGDSLAEIASVPGIGHILAQRIHNLLSIDTLEDLEVAAHDGRLKAVTGFGARRLAGVRDALAARLSVRRRAHPAAAPLPDVSEVLAVDLEYRGKAIGGELPLIAPRRFNPKREQWLPVFHTSRGGRALHGDVLQHGACAPPGSHARLGGGLHRWEGRRAAVYRGHRDARRARGPASRPRTRA